MPLIIDDLKPGDLLFFYGNDWTSKVITYYTWGPSHVGIVVDSSLMQLLDPHGSKLALLESTTMCPTPCLKTGNHINGIQIQDIPTRIAQYGTAPTFLKLRDECALNHTALQDFHCYARRVVGKNYDLPNAILSATNILKYLVTPDINTLFCSALVARLLMLVNKMNWANPEIYSPASLKRALLSTAVYERV